MSDKKVREVLRGQDLITIKTSQLAVNAAILMHRKGINALPVFERAEFVGLITRTDIDKAFEKGITGAYVQEIMTPKVKVEFITPDDTIRKCGAIMRERGFHHLVVRNDEGKVVGMISSLDVIVYEEELIDDAAQRASEMFPT